MSNTGCMICSSDGFTNILTLQIYEIGCCYLHSQYITIQKLSFTKKIFCRFVVSKFMKLSDKLISKIDVLLTSKSLLRSEFECSKNFRVSIKVISEKGMHPNVHSKYTRRTQPRNRRPNLCRSFMRNCLTQGFKAQ